MDAPIGEVTDLSAKLHHEIGGEPNPGEGVVQFNNVKILKPKSFCGVWDDKTLENFIFDPEKYFQATNIVQKSRWQQHFLSNNFQCIFRSYFLKHFSQTWPEAWAYTNIVCEIWVLHDWLVR